MVLPGALNAGPGEAVFFSISKAVEWLPDPVVWAAPLLVVAILLRKRVAAAVALAIAALLLPVVFASPVVASSLERWAEDSVRSSVRPGIEYDAARSVWTPTSCR
jgi:hypothetical protein